MQMWSQRLWLQPQHHCILPFVDVKTKKCIELVSDKEEEERMEDGWESYKLLYMVMY